MNRDDNNKGDNNYVEINLPEEGFIYGDDGPEVAPVDFDKQEELKHNSDGLDFPNKSKAIQTNEMAEEGHVTVYEENENKKDNGPAPIQGNPYNLSFPNSEVHLLSGFDHNFTQDISKPNKIICDYFVEELLIKP